MGEKFKLKKQADIKGITEKQLCERAVENNGGNIFKAAIELGVYPNAVRYHLNATDENEHDITEAANEQR